MEGTHPAIIECRRALTALRLQVPEEVANDVEAKVLDALTAAAEDATGIQLAEFNPSPGVKIIITLPDSASPATMEAAAAAFRLEFPDHELMVKTHTIKVEAEDGSATA